MADGNGLGDLREQVGKGLPFNSNGDSNAPLADLDVDPVRQLILGLPDEDEKVWPVTPAGIRIHRAKIIGRLDLDRMVGANGCPAVAVEFHDCFLTEGFSGAHGKFSRLSFFDCTFGNPKRVSDDERPVPTVDLTDAHIDGDLNMEGVGPEGLQPGEEPPRDQSPCLWIRAVGAQVNGKVELSRCLLRAPPPKKETRTCDEVEDALNLSLATIRGDLWMLCGARCEGRVKLRAAHVGGDVWMSGATVENPGGSAIFMQGARVDGFLMMDGRFDQVRNQGRFRRFRCIGDLSLEEAEIGRSFYLRDAVLRGKLHAPALSVGNDLVLDGEIAGRIKLEGCRIGGSLNMSRLNLACSAQCLSLKDGSIGRSLKLAYGRACYRLVEARHAELASLPGLELIETLWKMEEGEKIMTDKDVPEDRRLVQAAFLVSHRGRLNAEIFHLDGHVDVLQGAAARFDLGISRATAAEYGRLYGAHVLGSNGILRLLGCSPHPEIEREPAHDSIKGLNAGFFMASEAKERAGGASRDSTFVFEAAGIRDDRLSRWRVVVERTGRVGICPAPQAASFPLERVPRFRNGLIALPPLPESERNEIVASAGWLVGPALDGMTPYACPPRLEERLAHHIEWNPLLQAEIDLEGLSCDMLEDHGGGAWGEHLDPIRMNHFVYRRTNWESDDRWGEKKSSYRRVIDWGRGARADYLWLSTPGIWTRGLREECGYLEPWQVRRNWIYRHFTPSKHGDLISISRYRIPEEKYRSQPFEQAILVARAEGREDHAVRFEMLKSRNEWRLFNERARWWLGPIAITASSAWLFGHSHFPVLTVLAWLVTLPMMVWISLINDWLEKGDFSWLLRALRLSALYLAVLLPLFVLIRLALLAAPFPGGGDLEAILAAAPLALVLTLAVPRLRTWGWRGISAWWPRRVVREFVFYLPALVLLVAEWWPHPFHYVIAFLIYVGIRSAGVLSKLIMGLCFGYLRRPGRAIVTLILAFFLGWWGVHNAVERDMIVIDAAAVAEFAGPDRNAMEEESDEVPVLMGSWKVDESPYFVRELSCEHELSRRLYALDVLIPLIDLNEESRCDVRRIADPRRPVEDPGELSWSGLWRAIPDLPLNDHRFWWWAKALYAIAGWFIVSLALLTFTQVNKTHAEPPTEHR